MPKLLVIVPGSENIAELLEKVTRRGALTTIGFGTLDPENTLEGVGTQAPSGHPEQSPGPDWSLYVNAGQASHAPDPAASLYVPASHAVQAAPPSGPVYPTSQVQLCCVALWAGATLWRARRAPPWPRTALERPSRALHARLRVHGLFVRSHSAWGAGAAGRPAVARVADALGHGRRPLHR
eukprot:467088-Rhodomonas_salina.1